MILFFANMAEPETAPDDASEAALDQGEMNGDKAQQKVELDLDDAPFLDDEDDDEPLPMAEAELPDAPEEEEEEEKPSKRKYLIYAAAAAALVVLASASYVWIIPDADPLDETGQVEVTEQTGQEPAEPAPPPEPPKVEHTVHLKPFWVEKMTPDGTVDFLHLAFAFTTLEPDLEKEIKHKAPLLRDAIFYYLHNKEYAFLADTNNIGTVKEDLVSVLNQYIGNDQLETVYIETYLMK